MKIPAPLHLERMPRFSRNGGAEDKSDHKTRKQDADILKKNAVFYLKPQK